MRSNVAEVGADFDLRFELGARSRSNVQELAILFVVVAIEAFCDVCRNGERRASHLCHEAKALIARERFVAA